MDIIDKLKKEKKVRSVFDIILKSKEPVPEEQEKPSDIEVRELGPGAPQAVEPDQTPPPEEMPAEPNPIREFRTEGMHEFDIDSLGASGEGALRVEYKSKILVMIDEGRIDEAIDCLKELKSKLSELSRD